MKRPQDIWPKRYRATPVGLEAEIERALEDIGDDSIGLTYRVPLGYTVDDVRQVRDVLVAAGWSVTRDGRLLQIMEK